MITNLYKEFSLYLEGVKIKTFNSIQISEQENTIPAAQITFVATSKVLRILPGTIVHVFSHKLNMSTKKFEEILIFEGELTHLTYSRGSGSDIVSFRAISLLNGMLRAKLRPAHAVLTTARADAEMIQKVKVTVQNNVYEEGKTDGTGKPLLTSKIINNSVSTNSSPKPLEGTLNRLSSLAEFGKLADTMVEQLNNENTQVYKGNFMEFFKEMFRFFIKSDIYYGIQSISYKLNQSILALPNPENVKKFDIRIFWEAYNDLITTMSKDMLGNSEVHTLMGLLNEFCKIMGYKYIAPTTMPSLQYFHVKQSNGFKPVRMLFLPDFESGPPPLCNIFFPEQISDLNFSRDFMSEPTRVIGQMSYSFLDKSLQGAMMPITVVPDLNIDQPDQQRINSHYTDEESFRGVVLKAYEHNGTFVQALYKNQKTESEGSKAKTVKPLNKADMEGSVGLALRKFVLNDYLNLKYGQRVVQVSGEWSPYRLVGFPAMIFELGKPTIIGIISSISTTISSNGQAMSSCTIRNCRILFDEDFNSPTQQSSTDDLDLLSNYLTNDFCNGGFLGANGLMFNKQYYDFENIGKTIYPYLINGEDFEGSVLMNFFSNQKDLYPLAKNLATKKPEIRKDFSIISFVEWSTFKKIENIDTIPQEVRDTRLMYEAVRGFKRFYQSKENIPAFIDNITRRKLVTKLEYLRSINSGLFFDETAASESWKSTCKDLSAILQSKTLTIESLQQLIETKYDELNGNLDSDLYDFTKMIPIKLLEKWKKEIIDIDKKLITYEKNRKALQTKKDKLKKEDKELDEQIKTLEETIAADKKHKEELMKLINSVDNAKENNISTKDRLRMLNHAIFKPFNVTRRAHVQEVVKELEKVKNQNNINEITVE